jgi:uncharacterized protein YqeY
MSLEEKINADIKSAMLAKEKEKLEALRAVKSAILLGKTEKAGAPLDDSTELKILQRLVKQRKESAEIYVTQNRTDLAEVENFQAQIIESYLPAQLSEEELRNKIQEIISQLGATNAKDMGKVMSEASKQFAGKADGKAISSIVKALLGS